MLAWGEEELFEDEPEPKSEDTPVTFYVGDQVELLYGAEIPPNVVAEYGKGPFDVVAVMAASPHAVVRQGQWLFLEDERGKPVRDNQGTADRFSGDFFRKVAS